MAEIRGDLAVKSSLIVDGNASISKGLSSAYIEVVDVKEKGSAGGTFNAGTWQTRDLTDVVFDDFSVEINLAVTPGDSLSNIVLDPGAYYAEIDCPAYNVGRHVARLADVTDDPGLFGASIITGSVELAADTDTWVDSAGTPPTGNMLAKSPTGTSASQTRSRVAGKFVLNRTTTLEIQHRCHSTQASNGMGIDGGFYLTDNYFTVAKFWQLRDDS